MNLLKQISIQDQQYAISTSNNLKLMSSNQPDEARETTQLSSSSINHQYTSQPQDDSPINENSAQNGVQIDIRRYQNQMKKKSILKIKKGQVLFWIVVAFLIAAISYFINSNNTQEKKILSMIQTLNHVKNLQTTSNAKSLLDQKKISKQIQMIQSQSQNQKSASESVQQQKENQNEQLQNITNQQKKLKQYGADQIPKRLWHFSMKNFQKSTLWIQKCFQQHQRMASQSNYDFLSVNLTNFGDFLDVERYKIVKKQIISLNARYNLRQQPELIKYRHSLIKQLIALEILIENGGVFIDENILMTENLTWIDQINTNPDVNAKLWVTNPSLVAFHSVQLSSPLKFYESYPAQNPTDKYIVLYPGISPYFFAATKKNQLLKDIRDLFYVMLEDPSQISSIFESQDIYIQGYPKDQNYYQNIFEAACQIVLFRKQKQLQGKIEVIKHYKIATINQNYGLNKINAYLTTQPANKIFNHISRMTRSELEYQFGALRYFVKIEPIQNIYVTFLEYLEKKMIIKGSLIHEILFNLSNDTLFQSVAAELSFSERWEALPAKIWIYDLPKGPSLFNQIWMQNTVVIAKESNFELIVLSQENLDKYLSNETIKRIEEAVDPKRAKLKVYGSTKRQLISLAVLYEHGGVWIDSQVFLLESLQWLRNINKEKYLWNRNGKTPKVLLTFQPHYGSPFEWQYNSVGTKQAWHLSYDTSFKAAIPKAQLIKDWIEEIIADIATPFQDIITKFYYCQMSQHRWIGDWDHQMLPQDSIKCALGAKKVELVNEANATTPNEFYGLWAINGFTGLLKMREYSNFLMGRKILNPFLWRYSLDSVQKLIGKVTYFTRFYGNTGAQVQRIYRENIKDLGKEFHNESLFMKLIKKINDTIVYKDNGILQLSSFFAREKELKQKKEAEQLLKNMPRIVWIYYGGDIDENDTLSKSMLQNNQFYANASGYEVRKVDRNNYKNWLSSKAQQKVKLILDKLDEKLKSQKSNLKDHYDGIVGHFISLTLLYQLGGVSISKKLVLHQKLEWLQNVEKINFINHEGKSPPKVLGFFGPGYSSKRTNKNGSSDEFVQFPSFENYFYASGKYCQFMQDLIKQLQKVVMQKDKCKQKMKNIGHDSGWLHGEDPYYESLFLASQFVLSNKNSELKNSKIDQSAIDFYGLYTLNTRYYSYKLNNFLNSLQIGEENLYQFLGRTSLAEIQTFMGPLKYLSIIPKDNELRSYLTKSKNGQKGYQIMEKSFLYEYFKLSSQRNGIIKYSTQKSSRENKQWKSLPQNLWIYSSSTISQENFMRKLMFMHINKAFDQAGYKVNHVNNENIEKFIDKDMVEKIKKATSEKVNENYKQILTRLALLQKQGGISLPLNMLIIQKPTWIKNIANLTQDSIFNQLDENPKVLLLVDQLRNSASKWSYSKGTKVGHILGWIDDFIAADKDSELIKEWFNLLLEYLQYDPQKQAKTIQQCGLKDTKRSKNDPNKLSLDILQCVINRKHSQLQKEGNKKEVCSYYGLWGISEHLGPSKFQDQISLDIIENDLNSFLWAWNQSEAQSLIGKVNFMARLNTKQLDLIEKLIQEKKLKEWGKPNSFLVKTLYESTKTSLVEKDGKIIIKN